MPIREITSLGKECVREGRSELRIVYGFNVHEVKYLIGIYLVSRNECDILSLSLHSTGSRPHKSTGLALIRDMRAYHIDQCDWEAFNVVLQLS